MIGKLEVSASLLTVAGLSQLVADHLSLTVADHCAQMLVTVVSYDLY